MYQIVNNLHYFILEYFLPTEEKYFVFIKKNGMTINYLIVYFQVFNKPEMEIRYMLQLIRTYT